MNRQSLATVAVIVLAAAALWWARGRESRSSQAGASGSEPQAVVWKMVDASKARDVEAYLDCFAGDLRTRLDATVRQLGEDGFAQYLERRVEELKGVALYDVERPAEDRASITVEYVFAKDKELQRLHLQEIRGRWRIAGADASRREKSLIPYGTPIEQVE